MPDINSLFPSKYLKASDIGRKGRTLVIECVDVEDLGDQRKPVVYFAGESKGLVCNKTNGLQIASALGNSTDAWRGKSVNLMVQKVPFNGQLVDAIRAFPVDFDDEIPEL